MTDHEDRRDATGHGARRAAEGQGHHGPEPDFANEHDRTAVDRDIITGADEDGREPESPHGWSGMQQD